MFSLFVCSFFPYQDNTTPLYVASQNGHHDVEQTLLGAGAGVNIATSDVSDITYIRCCYIHSSTSSQQGLYYIMMTILTCHIQWSCIVLVRSEGTKASQMHTRRENSLKVNMQKRS